MARAAARAGAGDRALDDPELTMAAAAGEQAAFEELYRRNVPVAWRVAHAVAGNPDDASDAVADAFERVFRAVTTGRLSDNGAFRPYLLTATRRAAIDISRRSRRSVPETGHVEVETTAAGPADCVVAEVESRILIRAFKALDPRWRAVLWLIEVEELSCHEVATVLDLTSANVAQLACRARIGLRKRYLETLVSEHARPECRPVLERFASYAEGSLRRRQAAGVDEHLSGCGACRRRLEELQDLGVTLRRSAIPVPLVLGSVLAGVWTRATGVSAVTENLSASVPAWAPRIGSLAGWVPDVVPQAAAATPVVERVATWATAGLFVLGVSAGVASTNGGTTATSPGPAVEQRAGSDTGRGTGPVAGVTSSPPGGPAAPGSAASHPAGAPAADATGGAAARPPGDPASAANLGTTAEPAGVTPVPQIGEAVGAALGPGGAVESLVPAVGALTSQVELPVVTPLVSASAEEPLVPPPADLTEPLQNTLDAAPLLGVVPLSPPMAATTEEGDAKPQPGDP